VLLVPKQPMQLVWDAKMDANKYSFRSYGFSLVSTIIAVSLGTIIAAAVWQLYNAISSSGQQIKSKNLLTERSGMAIMHLTDDIKSSGGFGCFNARIAGNSQRYPQIAANESVLTASNFRVFESVYGGLNSFTSSAIPANDAAALAGESIIAGNDILKLQYGTNFAFATINNPLTFVQPSYRMVSNINAELTTRYNLDTASSTTNSVYVLASCNRFDQIQGILAGNTLPNGNNRLSLHDQGSARLMNFVTKYYYIANPGSSRALGLYSKYLLPNGEISARQLVIPGAVSMTTQYEVELNGNRQIKSRASMAANDWININQVILTLQLQSTESSGLGNKPLIESIAQSILLR